MPKTSTESIAPAVKVLNRRWKRGTIHHVHAMAVPITIPISAFEMTIVYERPLFKLLAYHRVEVIQGLFDALERWSPKVDDVEVINTGKISEQGVKLNLPTKKVSFFFGATSCRFVKEAAIWSEADEILHMLDTCLGVLAKRGEVKFGKKNTVLSLHLQLKTESFKDVLRPFISPAILSLDPAPSEAMAMVSKWPTHRLTLDGSAAIANGIYIQSEREFPAGATNTEIKEQIFNDEVALFDLLGVEEVDV